MRQCAPVHLQGYSEQLSVTKMFKSRFYLFVAVGCFLFSSGELRNKSGRLDTLLFQNWQRTPV